MALLGCSERPQSAHLKHLRVCVREWKKKKKNENEEKMKKRNGYLTRHNKK